MSDTLATLQSALAPKPGLKPIPLASESYQLNSTPASATRSALRARAELSATIVQVSLDERENRAAEERLKIDSVRLEVVR